MIDYDARNWYWQIGADTSRYWSSAVGGYVNIVPADTGFTHIASETELWDVLATQAPDKLPATDPRRLRRTNAEAQALRSRLLTATDTQINQFVDANATDLPGVRKMLKQILKIIAADMRED